MGGKKPVGEHPSRGSYFRRLHTSRGGHHAGSEPAAHTHHPLSQESMSTVHSLESEGDVPIYQDFSLFSAFSSSGNFGGILDSSPPSSTQPDSVDILRQHESLSSPEHGSDSLRLVDESPLLRQEPTQQLEGADRDSSLVHAQGPTAAQYSALVAQNSRLETSVRQLQEHVVHLLQVTDRLSYEHGAMVQHMQQSWQYAYAQMHTHGAECSFPPPEHSLVPDASASSGKQGKAQAHHVQPTTTSTEPPCSEVDEEIRQLKERLCTVEGRHKVVQGKVSQLDKLYGSTSASWGRHIKSLLQSLPQQHIAPSSPPSPAGDREGSGGATKKGQRQQVECCEKDEPAPNGSTLTAAKRQESSEEDARKKDKEGSGAGSRLVEGV